VLLLTSHSDDRYAVCLTHDTPLLTLLPQAFSSPKQPLNFSRLRLDWLGHEAPAVAPPKAAQSTLWPFRLVRFDGLVAPTAKGSTDLEAGALTYCGVFVAGAGDGRSWVLATGFVGGALQRTCGDW